MANKSKRRTLKRLAAEIELKRSQLNRLGSGSAEITDELLQLSEEVDVLIAKYMQLEQLLKKTERPFAQ